MRRKGGAGLQGLSPRFHFLDIYANGGGVLDPSNIGRSIPWVLVGDQQADDGKRKWCVMDGHVRLEMLGTITIDEVSLGRQSACGSPVWAILYERS